MSITHPAEVVSGVTTTWLPVTTAWPADSRCGSAMYNLRDLPVISPVQFDPFYGQHIDKTLSCLPPQATSWWYGGLDNPLTTVISMGPIMCPEMYTTALTSTVNSLSTFVACCPSKYKFAGVLAAAGIGGCQSIVSAGEILTFMTGDASATDQHDQDFAPATVTLRQATTAYAIPFNGYVFAQETAGTSSAAGTTSPVTRSSSSTDTSSSTGSLSSSSTSTSIPASTTSPSNLDVSSSSAAVTSKNTGLSSSAKLAIALGVTFSALGLLAIAGAIFFVRRHMRRQAGNAAIGGRNLPKGKSAELGGGTEYFAPWGQREWKELPAKEERRPNASMYEMSAERHAELAVGGEGR